jgi:CRP-like cAMP-binding protein
MKKHYLAVERGAIQTSIYPLTGPTTIGRSPDNTISIQNPTMSRKHAMVSLQEGVWTVVDLGSTNGVIVGGKRVQKMPLKPEDGFQIGEITFRFVEKEVSVEGSQLVETVEILSAAIEDVRVSAKDSRIKPGTEKLQKAIAAIPFFSVLGEPDLEKLANASILHVFNPGEIIIQEGDPGRSVYLILHGRVRVFTRDHTARELDLAILGPGEFFGEVSFLTGKPRMSFVAAKEASVLVELGYTTMVKLAKQHQQVKAMLVKYHKERIQDTLEKRTEAGMPERRHHPRLNERLKARFMAVSEVPTADQPTNIIYEASAEDISLSGAVLVLRKPAPVTLFKGSNIRLEITLPSPLGKIRTLGVVQRVQTPGEKDKESLLGVEFVGTSDEDTKKLKEFIYGEPAL